MIVDDILLLAARECGRKIAGLCARTKKAETKQPYDTDTTRAVGAAVLRSILTELGYRPEFVDSALGAMESGFTARLEEGRKVVTFIRKVRPGGTGTASCTGSNA